MKSITEDRLKKLYVKYLNHAGKNPIVRFRAGSDAAGMFVLIERLNGKKKTYRVNHEVNNDEN